MGFAIGLTSVRMACLHHLIESASITAPKDTGFNITFSNHYPTTLANHFTSPSCSWLELNNQDLDMLCGVWRLPVKHKWDKNEISTTDNITHNITFPFPYAEALQVLVWLKHIRLWSSADRSLYRISPPSGSPWRSTHSPIQISRAWMFCDWHFRLRGCGHWNI